MISVAQLGSVVVVAERTVVMTTRLEEQSIWKMGQVSKQLFRDLNQLR